MKSLGLNKIQNKYTKTTNKSLSINSMKGNEEISMIVNHETSIKLFTKFKKEISGCRPEVFLY